MNQNQIIQNKEIWDFLLNLQVDQQKLYESFSEFGITKLDVLKKFSKKELEDFGDPNDIDLIFSALHAESIEKDDKHISKEIETNEKPQDNPQKIESNSFGMKINISSTLKFKNHFLSLKQKEIQQREKVHYLTEFQNQTKEGKEFLEWLKLIQKEIEELTQVEEINEKNFFKEWIKEIIERIEENVEGNQIFLDLRKLLYFIKCGIETQKNLTGKPIIPFLGISGSGKSTTIQYLHGIKMIKKQIKEYIKVGKEIYEEIIEVIEGERVLEDFKIGHGCHSETK